MLTWLPASAIAGLPGLPGTKRGVLDLAAREGWAGRPGMTRPGRGRGAPLQYHLDLLPAEARAAAAARAIGRLRCDEAAAGPAAREPEAAALTAPAAEGRDARLALIAHIDRFREAGGLSATTADELYVARYNLGRVEAEPWIRAAVPQLAVRTVARWRALARAGTLHRLAHDPGARRRGKGMLERDEVRTFCLALIAHQPHLSADHVLTILADKFPEIARPSVRTVRLALATWRRTHKVILTKMTNPDAYKSKYRTSGTGSHQVTRLNELWMIDASPVDVLTIGGRQSIYVAIDLYSRRQILHITPTPRAAAVGDLMRRAIMAWGLCERLKTDNGSDFVAKVSKRLFASLGVDVDTSTPFAPWEKGQVERAIKTFQHDCGPLLPGFCGHDVAERKVIEARRAFAQRIGDTDERAFSVELTARELQRYADEWAAGRYAHRPHDGLNGVTPFAAAAGYVGNVKTVDVRALDVLLSPIAGRDGIRTVQKTGIRIDGSHYYTGVLPDTRVLVRMDPADAGRALLFSADGEAYLGEAVCPELAGVSPQELLAQVRAERSRIEAKGSAAILAAKRAIKPRDLIDAVLRQSARDAGKLVEFPRAAEAHVTPALAAAAEAAAAPSEFARPAAAPVEVVPDLPSNVTRLRETPQQRFRRALGLEAAMAAGESLAAADGQWLVGYAAGSEYRAMRDSYDDFGEAALL